MPEGVPRTDEERKEKHKETYGDEDIPEQRKGKASNALAQKNALIWAIRILLLLAIIIMLWAIATGKA